MTHKTDRYDKGDKVCIIAKTAQIYLHSPYSATRPTPTLAAKCTATVPTAGHPKCTKGVREVTTKEMKALVALARGYERATLLMEKVTRLQNKRRELESLGADARWLAEMDGEIARQKQQVSHLMDSSRDAHLKLQKIMGEIEDEYIYQLLSRHYLGSQSWVQIARTVGGGNTADAVRKTATRYLSKL